MFKDKIDLIKDEMIDSLSKVVNINSVYCNDDSGYPFGKGTHDALEFMLDLGKKMGFKTKNLDDYCGYIEFGEGEELVGIIGHLDVVPEGEGWTTPPFEVNIRDGKIYGRGTTDDKGPVMAALYAMKIISENMKINKRVRLILGLNEENDWKCVKHYKEVEEIPSVSFSPDADFPCIYAEKAILNVFFEKEFDKNSDIIIKNIDCKNNAMNVVPKYCKVVLESKVNCIDFLEKNLLDGVSFSQNDDEIIIEATGTQSHGAHPELGVNAIGKALIVLKSLFNHFEVENDFVKITSEAIGMETDGKGLGIKTESKELGDLTVNLAEFKIIDNKLRVGMNLRIPSVVSVEEIKNILNNRFDMMKIFYGKEMESLYISKDNELVKLLCEIYNDYMNENREPIAIGGGTYAKAFPNCVSFGAMKPDEEDLCHKVNEYISIRNLIDACNMYALAIYKLCI
ncbi:MAG: dipeptidase PepV [Clostridia bacterium]|nr:dipeptidase PepV [Clostridia bacterium]